MPDRGPQVNLGELTGNLSTLAADVRVLKNAAESEPETPSHLRADPFKGVMSAFAEEADAKVKELQDTLKRAEEGQKEARRFFGFGPQLKDDMIIPYFREFVVPRPLSTLRVPPRLPAFGPFRLPSCPPTRNRSCLSLLRAECDVAKTTV